MLVGILCIFAHLVCNDTHIRGLQYVGRFDECFKSPVDNLSGLCRIYTHQTRPTACWVLRAYVRGQVGVCAYPIRPCPRLMRVVHPRAVQCVCGLFFRVAIPWQSERRVRCQWLTVSPYPAKNTLAWVDAVLYVRVLLFCSRNASNTAGGTFRACVSRGLGSAATYQYVLTQGTNARQGASLYGYAAALGAQRQ